MYISNIHTLFIIYSIEHVLILLNSNIYGDRQFNILNLEKMTRLEVGQKTPVFLKWKSKHAAAEARSLSIVHPDPTNLGELQSYIDIWFVCLLVCFTFMTINYQLFNLIIYMNNNSQGEITGSHLCDWWTVCLCACHTCSNDEWRVGGSTGHVPRQRDSAQSLAQAWQVTHGLCHLVCIYMSTSAIVRFLFLV